MSEYTVTIHATQTMKIDARDAEQAIMKASKKLTSDWELKDAVAVDIMNISYSEDFYDSE